ncbi:hypothetical protein BQ9231_00078 [Cedratvirus lausannensis]|uniref:Uncharacterized protein n=2 Tax=Pithoviruses TaxID=2023203 RepID=A0A285PWG9_9VIRU|nr:hypothetical protein BQ9231_00078 [Cedratvirus lausannensis]SPN79855.1 Hypothetical protein ZAZAV_544 [Cedratvirus Zaza IHUMI]
MKSIFMNASLYSCQEIRTRIDEIERAEHKVMLVDEKLLFELIYFSALGEINKPVYKERKDKYLVLIDMESIERLKPFIRIDFPCSGNT